MGGLACASVHVMFPVGACPHTHTLTHTHTHVPRTTHVPGDQDHGSAKEGTRIMAEHTAPKGWFQQQRGTPHTGAPEHRSTGAPEHRSTGQDATTRTVARKGAQCQCGCRTGLDGEVLDVDDVVGILGLAVAPLFAPAQPRLDQQVHLEVRRHQALVQVVVPGAVLGEVRECECPL